MALAGTANEGLQDVSYLDVQHIPDAINIHCVTGVWRGTGVEEGSRIGNTFGCKRHV
jgi:hypothetical protein